MPTIKLHSEYKPIPPMAKVHESGARFVCAMAGARSGKSHGFAEEFIERIYLDRAKKKGLLRYWCCAPTYPLTRVQEEKLREALPRKVLIKERISERRWELEGNIWIEFKSTDKPQNLVAVGLDGMWVDESARVKPDAWRGQLRMRLSDRQGWALFSTTPLGRNWYWKDVCAKSPKNGGNDPDYDYFQWTTAENISIPALVAEVAKAKLELPDAYFKREYLGSPDAFIGQVFEWSEDLHVWHFDRPHENGMHGPVIDDDGKLLVAARDVWYAFDPGFRHYGVMGAYLLLNDGLILRVDERAARGKDQAWWVREALALRDMWGDGMIYYDPSRPDFQMAFWDAGLSSQAADNSVMAGISTLARLLHPIEGRPGTMTTETCELAISQMPAYRWAENEQIEKPLKENDDAPDEWRYGVFNASAGAVGKA